MRYILLLSLWLGMSPVYADSLSKEIEKAQDLVIKKERYKALNRISGLLKKDQKAPQKQELRRVGNEISEVFISDKSQQEYEAGLSLWMTHPERAIQKFQESLSIDPTNFLVIGDMARAQIANGNCRTALELAQEAHLKYEFSDNINLALVQANICLQKWTDADRLIIEQKKSDPTLFWYIAEADVAMARKDLARTQKALANAEKAEPNYVEIFLRRADLEELIKNKKTWAEKYVIACKNVTMSKFRNYKSDPLYCRSVDRMESVIRGAQYEY